MLDLLRFVTRVEPERLYLTEKEFETIEFGLKYFCSDYILIFKMKKSLMDVNITREEYDVQIDAIKAIIMNNDHLDTTERMLTEEETQQARSNWEFREVLLVA